MSYATLIRAFQSLLKEMKRRGGYGVVFIFDVVKCVSCGKQVLLRGIRTNVKKEKRMIEFYEGKCKHCGAITKVEWEKKY